MPAMPLRPRRQLIVDILGHQQLAAVILHAVAVAEVHHRRSGRPTWARASPPVDAGGVVVGTVAAAQDSH